MKKEYDFSNAEQGRFYRPIEQLDIPVYLDKDVRKALTTTAARSRRTVGDLVNTLLRSDLKIARSLQ